MDHNRVNADQFEQYDIARKTFLQIDIGHGIAAVFDDNGAVVEALQIGQCFNQHLGFLFGSGMSTHLGPQKIICEIVPLLCAAAASL